MSGTTAGECAPQDPFDLPEWLGLEPVTWSADQGLRSHLVAGTLLGDGGDELPCDLLAADAAYPRPAVDEVTRTQVHQAWQHGEVQLLSCGGRLTLAAPGTELRADDVLELLARLARAVGARPQLFHARLQVGRDGRR